MRIVLDTNILARATPGRDSPATQVLFHTIQSPHVLLASEFLLDELDRVLRYDRLRRIHGLSDEEIDRFVQFVRQGSQIVKLPSGISEPVVVNDPEDDSILATAILGKANVLSTLDRHLRTEPVKEYAAERGVRIVTDVELLKELRGG
ncbi:MAG TPA: putative toxin-antitoxin system toxin component, PIN family [Pirellulales bacterium]|jgi:putative PIN family toxin of toxin-antitoxin system|nr:putative toxin-antitoxin system toxin component, PIN family [Pirellulales bacterium]